MSKRKEILELLKKEDLTYIEIAEKTGHSIDIIRTYLSQFLKDKKVVPVDPTKGWHKKYRAIENSTELLKQLYELMNEKMDFTKAPDNNDILLTKTIEMVIKSE